MLSPNVHANEINHKQVTWFSDMSMMIFSFNGKPVIYYGLVLKGPWWFSHSTKTSDILDTVWYSKKDMNRFKEKIWLDILSLIKHNALVVKAYIEKSLKIDPNVAVLVGKHTYVELSTWCLIMVKCLTKDSRSIVVESVLKDRNTRGEWVRVAQSRFQRHRPRLFCFQKLGITGLQLLMTNKFCHKMWDEDVLYPFCRIGCCCWLKYYTTRKV